MAESPALVRENSLLQMFLDWEDGDPAEHLAEIVAAFEQEKAKNGEAAKAIGGSAFQKLVQFMVEDEVKKLNGSNGLGLLCISDKALNRKNPAPPLHVVKRNLLIDYGEYGCHLPDADIVIYREENCAIVCVVSCKTSLRDRMKQTAYWKLKFQESPLTRHIPVCLVTLDKDGDLLRNAAPHKKNYSIANVDLDATYVLHRDLEPHDRIRDFSCFGNDLYSWTGGGGGG